MKMSEAHAVAPDSLEFFSDLSKTVFAHIIPVSNENKNERCTMKGAPVSFEIFYLFLSGFHSHFPFRTKTKRGERMA
jgi:hypothetical protein